MVMFPPKPKSQKYQVLFPFYGFFLQTSSPFECEERFDWLSDWPAAKTKLTTVHWLGRGEVSGRGWWMMVTGAWSYRYHYQPTPTLDGGLVSLLTSHSILLKVNFDQKSKINLVCLMVNLLCSIEICLTTIRWNTIQYNAIQLIQF